MVLTLIALKCEVVEIVAIGYLVDLMIQLISAGEPGSLAGNHIVRRSAASRFPSAMPNRGIGFTSIGTHINEIFPSALNLKSQIRRIDFELIFVIEVPYAHNDGTLGQL